MLIIAHIPGSPSEMNFPSSAPSAPPIMSNGASTPPDVPDPSAMDHTRAFPINNPSTAEPTTSPFNNPRIVSQPTPSTRGSSQPPTPTNTPPIAGHHIQ